MTTTPAVRLGLAFVPHLPPERLRSVAQAVEAAGLDELWVWEDCFKESAIAAAAAALAWTDRITVGIGLMPVPLRNVALCAMEVATLERMFPGRLIAGVGHGVQAWMAQVGAKVDSPLTLLEEYATALRSLLAGERVTVSGRYVSLDDVALDWPPSTPPALMLGGTGPRSLALAARIGDGTMLAAALSEEEVAATCGLIAEHRRSDHHPVVATQIAATGPGAAARLAAEIPKWGAQPAPGLGVAGGAQQIAESIRGLTRVGITSVVIQPTEDEPDLEGFIHFLGAEVKPLLDAAP
jgi:5,10-methylenetetrahydromethanopterin reductase